MKKYLAALVVALSAASTIFACGGSDLSYRVRDDVIAQPVGSDDLREFSGEYYRDWRADSNSANQRDMMNDRRANEMNRNYSSSSDGNRNDLNNSSRY